MKLVTFCNYICIIKCIHVCILCTIIFSFYEILIMKSNLLKNLTTLNTYVYLI